MRKILMIASGILAAYATPAPAQQVTITPAPTWRACAAEGASCASRAGALVRYGAGTAWTHRVVNGAVRCDNTTFGDPAQGTVKTCAIASPAAVTALKPTPTVSPAPAPAPSPTPAPAAAKLGINVAGVAYWSGEATFANQATVLEWRDPAGGWGYVAADRLRGGTPTAIEPGRGLLAFLTPPAAAFRGEGPTTRCTWAGKGSVSIASAGRIVSSAPGTITFEWPKTKTPMQTVTVNIGATDASDPIRDIDCREPAEKTVFAAQLLDYLKPYSVLRFLDWTTANGNPKAVTWATRGTAGVNTTGGSDGTALEYQIGLANAVGASPWLTLPWNADDDYHRRAAALVKAGIPAGRQVYVEVANEVWNWQFGAAQQARDEGVAAKMADTPFQAGLHRYAQKTIQVMKIWAEVFDDRPGQLVRVAATQNDNPWTAEVVLAFPGLAANVDALATAPYFGHGFFDANPTETDVAKLMATLAGYAKGVVSGPVTQNAAIAKKYGKRFITYEAGQHVVGPDRLPLVTQMQRSPLMEPIYRAFIADMASKTDLLTLYAATGPISQYGAWGLREYAGQPIEETPKLRGAVAATAPASAASGKF